MFKTSAAEDSSSGVLGTFDCSEVIIVEEKRIPSNFVKKSMRLLT
jgi:hypothetical protein